MSAPACPPAPARPALAVTNRRAWRVTPGALVVASVLGAGLFVWPFLGIGGPAAVGGMAVGLGTVLALAAIEVAARRLDARSFALLATLSGIDAAARAAVVTGIGGFSPIFLLVLCGGYVFGPSYGFLLGAISALVSALVTGGLGPWLPYQLFAVGWVGAAAGCVGLAGHRNRRDAAPTGGDVARLAALGVVAGYGFGAVMDVWEWTFFAGSPGLGFRPGMGLGRIANHFAHFYAATSLVYDTFRAVGNGLMVVTLGLPVLLALSRLRSRFAVEQIPLEVALSGGPSAGRRA